MKGTSSIRTRAISSIRSTSRVTSRLRQLGTVTFQPSSTSKPKPVRIERCSSGLVSSPISSSARPGLQPDDWTRRQFAVDVVVAEPAGFGELAEQLSCERRRLGRELRIDPLLPAVRPLSPQLEPLGRPQERERLEVGRLEQDLGARVAHLRLLPAHDPGERDCPLRVGDHEVLLVELTLDAVERPELLSPGRPSHDDQVSGQRACGRMRGAGSRARA